MSDTPHTPQSSGSGSDKPSAERKGYIIKSGGLYHNVNISPRWVEALILVLIVLLIVLIVYAASNGGFTVQFDSRGGTDVPSQKLDYGDRVEIPDPPTREGYTFDRWYTDEGCTDLWSFASDTVQDNMTLYAGWIPNGTQTPADSAPPTQ